MNRTSNNLEQWLSAGGSMTSDTTANMYQASSVSMLDEPLRSYTFTADDLTELGVE